MAKVVPIFEKDGNEFLVCVEDFVAEDSWEASKIGMEASLVECILWDAKYTGKTLDVTGGILHRTGYLNSCPIAIISGPLFDEVAEKSN